MNDGAITTALKPCPFCGSADVETVEGGGGRPATRCGFCDAEGPGAATEAWAAELWNRGEGRIMSDAATTATAPDAPRRDLDADLAVCDAATAGPWVVDPEHNEPPFICSQAGPPRMPVLWGHWHPTPANVVFAAAAREGWPAAILRAKAAEAELAKLRFDTMTSWRDCPECGESRPHHPASSFMACADCRETRRRRLGELEAEVERLKTRVEELEAVATALVEAHDGGRDVYSVAAMAARAMEMKP
jgi:hypothetical protein